MGLLSRSSGRSGAALCLVLAVWGAAFAETPRQDNAAPGINSNYQDPEFERWRRTFESPGREVYDRRHAIMEALALEPGMDVADIGAGTGLFTRLVAREVGPEGKVYAVDIARSFVEGTLRIARDQGLENVEGVVNSQKETGLPPRSVDLAFVANTYHHFEYPARMLESIRRALRPGGELVIIDFRKEKGVASDWVMGHVRAGAETVIGEVTSAGFRLVDRERDLLRRNYFLRFRKGPGD